MFMISALKPLTDMNHPGIWEATGGLATVKMDELKNGIAGSPQLDRDHDTVLDSSDNCPNVPNSNQQDSDGNGRGDA